MPLKKRISITSTMPIQGIDVRVGTYENFDYINLSDIASRADDAHLKRYHIESWISNKKTLEFLSAWEKFYNPNYNVSGHEDYLKSLSEGATSTVGRWVRVTGAIGVIPEVGRYGDTYAHKDIAFEFASYVSPEFKIYLYPRVSAFKRERS